jgi:hypothetical protein
MTVGRRPLNPRAALSFMTLSEEVWVVLLPKHLITVSKKTWPFWSQGYIYIKHSTKHPTFSFVPWMLSIPAIVRMRKAVRTVSSLLLHF